ncbi:MAG: hypothetical protein FWG64_04185 [Firmicutes bacterium]|nr:hypothetical protein [Bacillota bacterium]
MKKFCIILIIAAFTTACGVSQDVESFTEQISQIGETESIAPAPGTLYSWGTSWGGFFGDISDINIPTAIITDVLVNFDGILPTYTIFETTLRAYESLITEHITRSLSSADPFSIPTPQFAFYDINGDNVPELFIQYETEWESYELVFAVLGSNPILLKEFTSRNSLDYIDENGIIYNRSSGGQITEFNFFRLSDNSLELVQEFQNNQNVSNFFYSESRGIIDNFNWQPLTITVLDALFAENQQNSTVNFPIKTRQNSMGFGTLLNGTASFDIIMQDGTLTNFWGFMQSNGEIVIEENRYSPINDIVSLWTGGGGSYFLRSDENLWYSYMELALENVVDVSVGKHTGIFNSQSAENSWELSVPFGALAVQSNGNLWDLYAFDPNSDNNRKNLLIMGNVAFVDGSRAIKKDGTLWDLNPNILNMPGEPADKYSPVAIMDDVAYISGDIVIQSDGTVLDLNPSKIDSNGTIIITGYNPIHLTDNAISVSGDLILKNDGTVWDLNTIIKLEHGISTIISRNMQYIMGNVVEIYHNNMSPKMAITADGTLYSWGNSWSGYFGNITDINVPMAIISGVRVIL